MASGGPFVSNTGLKRVTIKDLDPDLDNLMIVAVIIGKQTPRKFPDRNKDSDQFRAVWNFTLRDSPRDYINVSYWGPSDEVLATHEKFYTGDVGLISVELRNPRVLVRKFNSAGDQYCPMVTSPFSLILSEYSQLFPFNGDIFPFSKLLSFPTKPLSGYVPLRDIHNGGETMKERIIDILGAVRSVGPIKSIKSKKGQELQMREVILFDHTSPALRVAIWDTEVMMSASVTGRSIITENPIGKEAASLSNYAKSAPLDAVDILDQFIMDLPDPASIQNVMCVQQVLNKISNFSQSNASEPQITALMYVVLTQLDLDGPLPVTRVKCSSCRNLLTNTPPACENPDCATAPGAAPRALDPTFEIKVNLSDHTGTLANCRLSGSVAEQVLDCTVQQFLRMSQEQKGKLKLRYLMERCAVRIVVLVPSSFGPRMSIISCARADPLESAQRIPVC